jgi:hypothetical protein
VIVAPVVSVKLTEYVNPLQTLFPIVKVGCTHDIIHVGGLVTCKVTISQAALLYTVSTSFKPDGTVTTLPLIVPFKLTTVAPGVAAKVYLYVLPFTHSTLPTLTTGAGGQQFGGVTMILSLLLHDALTAINVIFVPAGIPVITLVPIVPTAGTRVSVAPGVNTKFTEYVNPSLEHTPKALTEINSSGHGVPQSSGLTAVNVILQFASFGFVAVITTLVPNGMPLITLPVIV